MKFPQLILVIVLSFAVVFVTQRYLAPIRNAPTAATEETAFDRVTRTNTLRCGYGVATPWMMVDPNTKKLYGVNKDLTEAVASKMGVQVDWVEETGWGVAEQGLITHRYDMMCGSVCIDPRRARVATFSTPFLHIPVLAVARVNDARFDGSLKTLNDKNVRIGVKTGHVFEFIANEQFPLAQKIYASDLSDDTEFFEMLKTNKIDIAFSGQSTVDIYNEKNSEKIKSLDEPVRFCNGAFMLPAGDERLKHLVDNAIVEINSSGQIKEILSRFMKQDPRYVRAPALPFQ
jgi:ABC-type amino acid transport substrate-binding protein